MKIQNLTFTALLFAALLSACGPTASSDAMMGKEGDMAKTEVKTDTMAKEGDMTKTDVMSDTMAKEGEMTKTEVMSETEVMSDTMSKEGEVKEGAVMEMMAPRIGALTGRDAQHQGSGTVTLHEMGGKPLLTLTNFSSSEGPDLFVWLVENPNTYDANALGQTIDLGALQSISGDQTYEIPADTDLSKIQGMIIYCKEFSFVFSTAPFAQ